MASGAPEPAALSARRIVSTRMVGATPEVVSQAFADPDRLARWWGPKGFTNTFHEFEILRPERIVFDHVALA